MAESIDRKRTYRVSFSIEVDAIGPDQAAKDAIEKLRSDWTIVTFNVQWTGFSEPPPASETQAAPTD